MMTKDEIIQTLKANEPQLRQRFGVRSLALFGSVVRGEATDRSDIDVLVEFDRPVSMFELFRLEDHLSELLDGATIDLVLRRAVIDDLKEIIFAEAVDVVVWRTIHDDLPPLIEPLTKLLEEPEA